MKLDELVAEAQWVIERLVRGQKVLVHCVAGFNRSVTLCCAIVMLIENLSAEAALARVRQNHPWALPDSHHWLVLRWLAQNLSNVNPVEH
jgi:protein-tyrosine phosphatase